MENASKALLIAASVLIVILLIAFGMSIFKSGTVTGDALEDTMSDTEKASFNSKFTAYCGTSKSAAQAKALAQVIISNNATSTHKVNVKVGINSKREATSSTFATDLTDDVSRLSGSVTITAFFDSNTGILSEITIN